VHVPYINTKLLILNELLVLNSLALAHIYFYFLLIPGFVTSNLPFVSSCHLQFTIDSTYRLVLILVPTSVRFLQLLFRRLCKSAKSYYLLRHVCPST